MSRSKHVTLLAALALVALVFTLYSWGGRPHRHAERFVALLSRGEIAAAGALLHEPAELRVLEGGGLALRDEAGASVTVPRAGLPFQATGDGPRRSQLTFWLAEEQPFEMVAIGDGSTPAVHLDLRADLEGVHLEAVR
ncbi:MAG: hypothetical protein H6828_02215 [Planctomycetes bacterium]|nr:hypothetical protein [Planctomycetota bacterium]